MAAHDESGGEGGASPGLELVLFEESFEALFVTRLDGHIELANEAARELSGYSLSELTALKVDSLILDPSDCEEFGVEVPPALLRMGGREAFVVTQQGARLPAFIRRTRVKVYDADRILLRITDLREHAEVHASLRNQEEKRRHAEQAKLAQSAFLAGMSHEIRTPLNAVMGFAQLLRRDPSLSGPSLRKAEGIERAGSHLLKLVNDVLEISKIESGQARAHLGPCQVEALVDDVFSLLEEQATDKGIELRKRIAPDVPLSVITDGLKVRQILINLVGNAVKFTERGRIVVLIGAQDSGIDRCELNIQVMDNGPGIDPDEALSIFDKFSQGRAGTAKQGTGLGLAISRQYAHLLGGDLTVESEPGHGSCFQLRLPVTWVKYRSTVSTQGPASSGRTPKIAERLRALVVDDDEDSRVVLSTLLEEMGFICERASSGFEALRTFEFFRPQAVFTDLYMPGMDGFELITQIRALEGGKDLMVIALSAHIFADGGRDAVKAGANAFLAKPFQVRDLQTTITHNSDLVFWDEGGRLPSIRPQHHLDPDAVRGELREAIADAARAGDLDRLLELAETVEDAGICEYLRNTAHRYDYEKIVRFFTSSGPRVAGGAL